ncbi:MAG: cyclic 2,3-diphosphoglycerate synthase [Candidatus Baldrarchaeia archaeon]
MKNKKRVIIMGAAGRDFHNFNVFFRNNDEYEVVAFTAAQIPFIENRKYPAELAGPKYPNGIPIFPEDKLPELIKKYNVDQVVLAYSDLTHEDVMHKASLVLACGADFVLLGPKSTMIKSKIPVIAVCAVRTGAGKSTVTRRVCDILRNRGLKVVVVRHPMPYGDLVKQKCQRFETLEDLDRYNCTIEEREEFEPLIERGLVVYAGVDYEEILKSIEREKPDVIVWDGGNNDFPFFKPDLMIVVADPHRPGQELSSYPGESNVRMADVVIINKVDSARPEDVETVKRNVKTLAPDAAIIEAASPVFVDDPDLIKGKRVAVVEDGPTVTHGHLGYAAGYVAAKKYNAAEIVDPRPYAVRTIKEAYEKYPHLREVVPSLGYSPEQIKDLEETLNNIPCDTIVAGTPIDLKRIIKVDKPIVRVKYELKEVSKPSLEDVIERFLERIGMS